MQAGQASVIWDRDDDWRGLNNSAARRRRQNRLNQRLLRQRRHLQRQAFIQAQESVGLINTANAALRGDDSIEPSGIAFQKHASSDEEVVRLVLTPGRIELVVTQFKQKILLNHSIRLQKPTDLPTLTLLNVINGLATNAVVLSIPFRDLDLDDSISQFNVQGPRASGVDPTKSAPSSLQPTELQKAIVHHPWIDIFPIPGVRDNILRCISSVQFDEDEICHAIFGIEIDEEMISPITLWGDASDPRNWEFSPAFLKKWRCLVQGCSEVIESTNFWRQSRGQPRLSLLP